MKRQTLNPTKPAKLWQKYSAARGWEEGVVEQMQRLLRQEVFSRLGIEISEDSFVERDEQHEYNRYVEALENLRRKLGQEARDFYDRLLATPLPDRLGAFRHHGETLPEHEREAFRRMLMLSQAKLGRP